MDLILIIFGIICLATGILGCILPVIPGPPIAYFSLILLHLHSKHSFSTEFLVTMALVVIIVTILDYVVPVWGTKKFGGSKKGVWGSTAGLIIGLFFGPIGIIAGPFIGALAGELIDGKAFNKAVRSAIGAFLGFVVGVIMKLGVSVLIAFQFFKTLL